MPALFGQEKCDSCRHSTMSLNENVEVAETNYQHGRSFNILRSGQSLTPLNKIKPC